MDILQERQRVCEMTAQCRDIGTNWRAPPQVRWFAELWCSQIGEYVYGFGPDAWTAVQSAHALREIASGRGAS